MTIIKNVLGLDAMPKILESFYSKQEIRAMIDESKVPIDIILNNDYILKKKKPKASNPQFYAWEFDLTGGYKVHLQSTIDNEFPTYSAILMKGNIRICRLDYHDPHRRNCKKQIFPKRYANELHLHIYCIDCVKEGFDVDAFVLDINFTKLQNLEFLSFVNLFFTIIHVETFIKCEASLEFAEDLF
ncbi:hypothetical protein [Sulfurospirillum cavolei]|uniref:hypothetical protein n=1 Tax=Sulfurospirillum cavolei TaxID=366522 RepID=UPI003FA2E337